MSYAIAGPNGDQAQAVRTDAAGNVYELATDAVYKYSPTGVLDWSTPFTAFYALNQKGGIAIDGSGNVYIAGNFSNGSASPAQFGATTLASSGGNDGYLAKLDSSGNFVWAQSFGGNGEDKAQAVAVDSSGDVFIAGDFSNTATIGAGAQSRTFTSKALTGALVAKFNTDGLLLWANAYTESNSLGNEARGIAVDAQGNAYVTGFFDATLDFNPAQPGRNVLTTFFESSFILKLDSRGHFVWVRDLGTNNTAGDGRAQGDAIALDSAGNVYSTGIFGGPVDLNPSGGDLITTSDFVFPDAYVLKLDNNGNFAWAADLRDVSVTNPFGGIQPADISVDAQGNVYTAGGYQGVDNFDPSGSHQQTSSGFLDIYVSALNTQGQYLWAATAGENTFDDYALGVTTSTTTYGTNIYACGVFTGTVNYNSGIGAPDNVTANGTWDGFLWGLNNLPTRIAGVVFNDENGDGVRQSSEPGLLGLTVTLFAGTPGSGTQIATTTTDPLGLYSFNGLATASNYYVQVTPPVIGSLSPENAGTDLTLDSNVSPATGESDPISIVPGQTAIVNAGMQNVVLPPVVNRAFGISTIGFTAGSSIVGDGTGAFYVAGSFLGTTTFGTGASGATLSTTFAPNDFVAKYAANGALLWARQLVSDYGQVAPKLMLDKNGNVYLAGEISGDTTFGAASMSDSKHSQTAYLAKLDSSGKVLWATTVLPSVANYNVGLAVDPAGNSYVVGGFTGSETVSSSPSTTLVNAGGYDVFAVKYSTSGAFQWAKNFGGSGADAADSAAIDPAGNPVLTGSFTGTAQFGGVSLSGGSSVYSDFVLKLNAADGSVAWARALTSSVASGLSAGGSVVPVSRIAVDSSGNVYSTGTFDGLLQLDPNAGSDAIKGTNATFISKLDNNGNFVWGKAFTTATGGYDVEGLGIAVDAKGDVFTTGEFAQTINFDPNGSTAQNLTSLFPSYDVFLSELDSNGNYLDAQQFGGAGEDEGTATSVDALGNIYATGVSIGPSAFGKITVGAKNEQDIFAVRLGVNQVPVVNVAPSFVIQGPLQSLNLNAGPQTVPQFAGKIVVGVAGEPNEIANFNISNDNPSLFLVQPTIDDTGTLTYTPANDAAGTANVTVTLHNNGGSANGGDDSSAPQSFPITIAVNHAPSFKAGTNVAVDEDGSTQLVPGWATNISPGPPNEATQSVTFNITTDNDALFAVPPKIDPVTGDLTYTPAPDMSGMANVSVQLQDNGGTDNGGVNLSATQNFTITVNFVNDAPSFTLAGDPPAANEDTRLRKVTNFATQISPSGNFPPEANEAGQTVHFTVVDITNPDLFTANGAPAIDSSGTLTYTLAPNVSGSATITVDLADDGGTDRGGQDTSATQSFTITVNPVNDAPSFTIAGNPADAAENSGSQVVAGFATAISPSSMFPPEPNEASQSVHFNVTGDDNPSLFATAPAIDATGTLTYTVAPDAVGSATITIDLQDDGGTANGGVDTSAPRTFTITVDLVNHAPSFKAGSDVEVNENSGPQTVAGWASQMSAGPANEARQKLDFNDISNDNGALFSSPPQIDPITGALTFTPAPDQFGVAHLKVALHDDGGTAFDGQDISAFQTFTITVDFVNQPPSFTSGGSQTVHETPGPQLITAWATNVSPGAPNELGQKLDFEVTTDNDALFSALPAIDSATGDLTYTPLTYATGTAHVTVRLHDDGGTANGGNDTSASQTFTVLVTPSNQAPIFDAAAVAPFAGTHGQVTVKSWATSISAGPANESGQALDFAVSTDNDALFLVPPTVDAKTGDLTFTPQPQTSGQADVTVRLHDNGGIANGGIDTSAPVTFLLSVSYVNAAPSFLPGANQVTNENSGSQAISDWASSISAGPPDETTQALDFQIATDNDALFSVPPAIDPKTGTLTYTPALDANGVAHVTVKLHDSGGTANKGEDTSAATTLTITVNPVNQPPVFAAGSSIVLNEGAAVPPHKGWATGISAGAANESSQKLTFNLSTDNSALFTTPPSIDPATGDLTFTPAPGEFGVAHVTATLSDDGGTTNGGHDTSAPQTFTITINFVNQPPNFTVGDNQTIDEDAPPQTVSSWATNISPGAAKEAGQLLTFIVSTDNPTLFTDLPQIDASTGQLTYTPAPNVSGVANIKVQLHDDGGVANGGVNVSAPQTFSITVNQVNDAPSFAPLSDPPAVVENSGLHTVGSFATNISPSSMFPPEANEEDQSVHFNVTGDTNPALFTVAPAIDASGTLSYTLAPNVSGSSQITVDSQDNGGTADGGQDTSPPQSFTIHVNFVNQAPRITQLIPNQRVDEDSGPFTLANFITSSAGNGAQEAAQRITYLVSAANPSLFSVQPSLTPSDDASPGTLTFTPALHAVGSTVVTVVAHDDGGTANGGVDSSLPATFVVEIDQANHAPTLASGVAPVTVNENAADVLYNDLSQVFDDVDVDLSTGDYLTLAVSSDNPGLVTPSLSSTSPATARLTLHFAPSQAGTATIDLRATDRAGASIDDKIPVTVNAVNQPPSFSPGNATVRVAENAPGQALVWATDISPGPNQSNQTVTFSVNVSSTTNPNLFSAVPTIDSSGKLTFTPAANQTGKATLTVTLHNSGGTANGGSDATPPQTLMVAVDPVPVAIDHSYILGAAASIAAPAELGVASGDAGQSGLPLTAILVSGPSHGTLQLNSDGSFIYTRGADFTGQDSFTYRVSDGQSISNVATVNLSSDEAAIITKLYNQVLKRAPDGAGLAYWVNAIDQGASYDVVAKGIFESPERLDPIIESYYQQFLLRPSDAAGLAYWTSVWTSYGGPEPVVAGMISSPEFFASSQSANPSLSPNAAWVSALYQRLLGRDADQAGLNYWVARLDSGQMSRSDVVNGFNSSTEYYQSVATALVEQYLGRLPSAAELQQYVSAFEMGSTQRTIQVELIDSAEYRDSPPPASANGVSRLV